MLLKGEDVYSMLEFGRNQMLISVQLTDMLIVNNWKVMFRITDSNPGNFQKCWLAPLPGFNFESFPFIVASGHETINLINVKEYSIQPLIQSSSRNVRSQQAAFFT